MQHGIKQEHWNDANGKPAGGCTYGVGFAISWQNGPLGRGPDRHGPNGAFVEDVIVAVRDRIQWYQDSGFNCAENERALAYLGRALTELEERTLRREKAGVEGTHVEEAIRGA